MANESNPVHHRITLNQTTSAAQYDSWYDSPLGKACWDREEKLLTEAVASQGSKRILEVGCGTGRFLMDMVMKKQCKTVGIDKDISFLYFAKKKGERSVLRLNLVQADATALPFQKGQFDTVYEITTLCFIQHEQRVLEEMIRICSNNGRILLGELNPVSPWQWWRRLKGWFGYGSFKGARWHSPSWFTRILRKKGCRVISIQKVIFFPPLSIRDYLQWRDLFEWVGSTLFPWIGAFYLITATKQNKS